MAGQLLPEDDLYARLEVSVDASPEAIELAWRALLRRHHPDVAGEGAAALERAKRINVAHDWLSDPDLRARYDRERLALGALAAGGRTGVRHGRSPRGPLRRPFPAAAAPPVRRPGRQDVLRGDPSVRLARFLDRVTRLRPDEPDRLAAAEPPPIAFLATIRRFLTPEARAAFEAAEVAIAARVSRDRWAAVGLREGLLGVAAELVLAPFLDETLAEPFRGRARERLLRAWDASLDQPRYGPNGAEVVALRSRVGAMTPAQVAAFLRASHGIPGEDRPWPAALDRDEDEALRISALLAAADVASALAVPGLAPATEARARRLLGRLGHATALRHAFPAAAFAAITAPFLAATGAAAARPSTGPGVRRAR